MTPSEYKREWRRDRKQNDPNYREKCNQQARASYQRHRDEINKKRREAYKHSLDIRQKISEDNKAFRAKKKQSDPEYQTKINAKGRARYESLSVEQKRSIVARQRKWLENNPEKKQAYLLRKRKERHFRYKQQLEKAFEMLGGKCSRCNCADDPLIYDFHHVDPKAKLFTVSEKLGYFSWAKLEPEIKKCILLCSPCHRKLHHGRFE